MCGRAVMHPVSGTSIVSFINVHKTEIYKPAKFSLEVDDPK